MSETDFSGSVVVVSDDPHLRREALFAFSDTVEVAFASDAREGWKLLESNVPDVVVVDMQTGSAGGFGLATDMSQSSRTRDVPILMLLERRQDEWLARQAGARRIRVKPIDVADLARDVAELARGDVAAA